MPNTVLTPLKNHQILTVTNLQKLPKMIFLVFARKSCSTFAKFSTIIRNIFRTTCNLDALRFYPPMLFTVAVKFLEIHNHPKNLNKDRDFYFPWKKYF